MDFHPFTTNHEACRKFGLIDSADESYAMASGNALQRASSEFYQQLDSERTWEQARKPSIAVPGNFKDGTSKKEDTK